MQESTPHPVETRASTRPQVVGWHLAPHRTISLFPAVHSVLRIKQGRVWVTTGTHPAGVGPAESGDWVLQVGDELQVPLGVHLVMESWPAQPDEAVRFDWFEPVATPARVDSRFQQQVRSPARDLVQELWLSAAALGRASVAMARVVRGLVGYAEHLVAGRGRVLTPLESVRS